MRFKAIHFSIYVIFIDRMHIIRNVTNITYIERWIASGYRVFHLLACVYLFSHFFEWQFSHLIGMSHGFGPPPLRFYKHKKGKSKNERHRFVLYLCLTHGCLTFLYLRTIRVAA